MLIGTGQRAPQEGDIVIEGKRGLDTFASTTLTSFSVVKALGQSVASAPIAAPSRRCGPDTSTAARF